ncbi:hypothetical protein M405DRAFT_693549, partial [Rhizopogon salebrosus TDB-379]
YIKQSNEPLRLFLSGPGGTGKTHSIMALQSLMTCYNFQHILRFLAPTGSAASLIDGVTIHKAFGIKIQAKDKGHLTRTLGSHIENFSFLMIDEISLLS